jgi:cold shock CspA family protein
MRKHGVVTRFGSKGFGFVLEPQSRLEYFFHIADVKQRISLKAGDHVTFEVGHAKPGTKAPVAILVELIETPDRLDAVRR